MADSPRSPLARAQLRQTVLPGSPWISGFGVNTAPSPRFFHPTTAPSSRVQSIRAPSPTAHSSTDEAKENFKWGILREDLPIFQMIRSRIFRLKDCSMDCILSLQRGDEVFMLEEEENPDFALWLYTNRKGERVYGTFSFFIDGSLVTTLSVRNRDSDNHLVAGLYERKHFPEHREFSVEVKWLLEKKCVEQEDLTARLVKDLSRLQLSGKFSDRHVQTDDKEMIPVHRGILAARSPVLLSQLTSDRVETSQCIRISDFSTQTVNNMIRFMYTSRLPEFDYDSFLELLKAAHLYEMQDLKRACVYELYFKVNLSNVVDLLLLADTYQEHELKEKALHFIFENRKSLAELGIFNALLEKKTSVLVDILSTGAGKH